MRILKKIFSIFLRIAIGVALLVVLFKINKIDIHVFVSDLKAADKGLLVLAFLVFFLNYVLCFYRWQMLLNTAHIHISTRRTVLAFAGGIFFNLFLPSSIGGDLIRSIDLSRHTNKPKEVVATVLLDRLSGYVGLVALVLFSLFLGWKYVYNNKIVITSVAILFGLLTIILLVLFNRTVYGLVNKLMHSPGSGKIRQYLVDLHQELHVFRHHKVVIMNNLLFSLFVQIVSCLTAYIIGLSLGVKTGVIYFFMFLPIVGAASLLPVSIGGLGVREGMMIYLFRNAGVKEGLAIGMSLINFSFILTYGILGGVIYVLTVRHRRVQHHKPSHLQQGSQQI